PLEGLLLLAPGVRGEELALLLELVAQLVVVDFLAVHLLLHGRLFLLDLLSRLHAGLRARQDALEVDGADPGGGASGRSALLRSGGSRPPPENGQRRQHRQRRHDALETPHHSSLLLARTRHPSRTGHCRSSLSPWGKD